MNAKRIITSFFIFMIFAFSNIYSQLDFDINRYIENPEVFGENKEEPAAILIPYQNFEKALQREVDKSSYYLSLNGNWKFDWKINPALAPKDFYKKEFNDKTWKEIPVPSNWQMLGYDHQMYRNIPMEFYPYNPPYVPDDINPTGFYRKKFKIPSNWKERKIYIHFDGVQSAAFVWLNGKYIGYHEDGMTPAEFDITDKIEKGENILAVMVLRWCDGSYLEDQDMFRFSGIYRNVYLYSKPQIMIRDLFIKTDLDENYVNANLILDFTLKNYTGKSSQVKIKYTLLDKENNKVHSYTSDVIDVNDKINTSITQKINNPQKWSDEHPYLYKLIVELIDKNENVIEIISQRVGFRELEVKNGIAMMNGMPIYFRGTNRHEISPTAGKTLTKELMIEDIKLLKQFNFNSVRTSHYPNDPLWYELCDEYGILLQDEVNAECHYTENEFPSRSEYFNAFMDRFIRMVQRDKNHPSVVMWSTGNECGLDKPHYAMADYIRKFDPTRFLMHQSNWPDGEAPYVDIIGPRYPTPTRLRQIGLTATKPVVMGEYAHAMGNSLGNFDEFWEIIYSIPKLQGGFVWDWVDQGLKVKAKFVKDYSKNDIQCAVMGNPELVKGVEDNAIKLSGLDDWIEVYDDERLDIRDKNLFIELTVFPQKFYQENSLITKGYQFGIKQIKEDSLSFYINSYRNSLKIKLPDDWYNKWHKVKAIYDGKEMSIIIDEKVLGKKEYSREINSLHYPVNIGRDSYRNDDQHLGWLSNYIFDEVKLSDKINGEPILWIKFDEIKEGQDYYTYGISPFCINGMVTADRKPQPELWQAKHSMSPVRFYSVNLSERKFKVVNKNSFTNLNYYDFEWLLYKDGVLESSGKFDINLLPQQEKEITLPIPKNLDNNSEYVLEISCKQKYDEPFKPKGFEINFEQFVLNKKELQVHNKKIDNAKIIEEDSIAYSIKINENTYQINKRSGDLKLIRKNNPIILSMTANVWRPPISNEKVDWGKAEAEDWYRMGLNEIKNEVEEIKIDTINSMIKVKLNTTFSRTSDIVINEFTYKFNERGEVDVKHLMIPLGYFNVNWLPCIGLKIHVPDNYKNLTWYGRGPIENYPDRKTGAKLGIHKINIDSLMNPYIEPQEYGNYSDVRWFELKNASGEGISIIAKKPLHFSVVPYYNLDRSRYTFQLKKDDYLVVRLNYNITGVGDTPNPAMPQYRVYPEIYYSSFTLIPIY
ncbi:glycoside hydrolase family 2 TIM barrel-domain containing protein [Rosettibacter firmus]|uniref:glycoside hydrolase family 2 TIM barrel-domain containing protein n=1 Tax=Rosettibacter firmus TaxID=3111522 RepID=UPI00336C18A2